MLIAYKTRQIKYFINQFHLRAHPDFVQIKVYSDV